MFAGFPLKSAIIFLALSASTISACSPNVEVDKDAYLEKALELAGDDYFKSTAELQCGVTNNAMQYLRDKSIVPPTRIFDNLIYLGKTGVGSFALPTKEGIILIDTLNSTDDVKKVIEPGLRSIGLDPASIKDIIITQGHGDHYGGAQYLADTYGSRIHMSAADWDLVENPPEGNPFADLSRFSAPPKRDLTFTDGQKIVLGEAEITIVLTPGHSPETASLIFPVYEDGKRHMVGMWGGSGIPRNSKMIEKYIASTRKFLETSKQYDVDVEINGHAFVNDGLRRMKQMRENPNQPNPFVIGPDRFSRYTQVFEECAKLALAKANMQSDNP